MTFPIITLNSEVINAPVVELPKEQKIPTKKVTRIYRGQTYEIIIPDYSIASSASQNKPKQRRKYRGQYID